MDAGFSNDGHEICVTAPAGQNVEMDVTGNTCAGDGADIETEVETFTTVNAAKVFFG